MKKEEKIIAPKRFIIRIICNNCGIFAPTQFNWLPDRKLFFRCTNCQDEEVFDVLGKESVENMVLTKEVVRMLGELFEEKTKERTKN